MIRIPLTMVVILVLGSSPAHGSGLSGLSGGWLFESSDEQAVLAGGPPTGTGGGSWWMGGGVSRLFGLEDLPVSGLACGFASADWSVGAGWQRTGQDLFVEDRAEILVRLGRAPRLGVRMGLGNWSRRGYATERAWDPALELTLGVGSPWSMRVTWHPADAPEWHGRTGRRELARVTWVRQGAGMVVAIDRNSDGVPAVGLHGMWRLDRRMAVGIRADPVTGSLGPCLTMAAGKLTIRTSHLVHPALGMTHRFMLGLGQARAAIW
jgi:hypothetical protein